MNNYLKHNKVVFLTQYHFIWCPKYRRNLLIDSLKTRLENIIKEVSGEHNAQIKALEIMPNHVHLFVSLNYKEAPYKFIKAVKGRSSNLLRKEFANLRKMPTLWTRSYFVSSIGVISEDTVKMYIENQWIK